MNPFENPYQVHEVNEFIPDGRLSMPVYASYNMRNGVYIRPNSPDNK